MSDQISTTEQALQQSLQEYHSLKEELETKQARLDSLRDRLLMNLKTETMEGKRAIFGSGEYQAIVTKRMGNIRFNYDAYILDQIGEAAIKEVEQLKQIVKDGSGTSKYVDQAKSVFSLQIVKGTPKNDSD